MSESYLSQSGPMQLVTDTLVIAKVHGAFGPDTAKFRAMNPDSRVRLKITVAYVDEQAAVSSILAMTTHLYLGEEEHLATRGRRVLCTDILRDSTGTVVTQSSPLVIPEDAGLQGFTTEFVTAADSILGIFDTLSAGGRDGWWIVNARWQPDGQRLCDGDWEFVKRKCHLLMVGDPIIGGE